MTRPQCMVQVWAEIKPSEDAQKVCQAIRGVLPDIVVFCNKHTVSATSDDAMVLDNLRNAVMARQIRAGLRRNLVRNTNNNTTKFYLNKQASFVSTVAICDEQNESPMGPIQITITSPDLDSVIGWLCGKVKQNNNNF